MANGHRIQDYAIIGDCRSAALVARDGSIDWLCWPRFDSPSIFGALLDERAGRFRVAPAGPFESSRRYLAGTNVLETTFRTPSATLVLTDLMTVASEEEKSAATLPDHQIVRQLEALHGEVAVEIIFQPRPDFARRPARLRAAGPLGIRAETPSGLLVLRTDLALGAPMADELRTTVRLRPGNVRHLSLTFDDEWPAILPPLGAPMRDAVARSIRWWRGWIAGLRYDGPCRDAVERSALALRLLVYAPSGAVIAAPTTSLPERVGGDLNWDYRYCWLRDASFTMRAFLELGFRQEADAFLSWLLHSTRLTRPALSVLYDVYGNRPREERTLEHLVGYRGSRPVRVGNAAVDQLQLDVYGEVIDAAARVVRDGGSFDRESQRMLRDLGRFVCGNWNLPDEGVWESRTGRARNTHSRLLCWTALDRLIDFAERGLLRPAPVDAYREVRGRIDREIRSRAWNDSVDSYVSQIDGSEVDAALLLLAWHGFEPPSSDRMRSTYRRIRERLGAGDDLLFRHRDPALAGEGAFGICSFWAVDYLARGGGEADEAAARLERLAGYANDVGLFAEEIDPRTGDALGNFPQAFTHVGLINAALSVSQRRSRGAT